MDRYKWISALLAGVVVGMACGKQIEGEIMDTAVAADSASSTCEQWEAMEQGISASIPPGWEPFGFEMAITNSSYGLAIRRCAD